MKTFILVVASLVVYNLKSQTNNNIVPPAPIEQSKFSIGVTGGFGHSFLVPYNNITFRPSWDAGVTAIYAPGKHWGIGADVLYSVEGAKFLYADAETQTDYTKQTELNYVRIPVKAIYFFRGYEKDFRPKITLGPSLGVLVGESNRSNAAGIDLGGNVSVGFNYRLARAMWINLDAVYYQGFLDAYNGNTERDLNGNIRLNAGINLGF